MGEEEGGAGVGKADMFPEENISIVLKFVYWATLFGTDEVSFYSKDIMWWQMLFALFYAEELTQTVVS